MTQFKPGDRVRRSEAFRRFNTGHDSNTKVGTVRSVLDRVWVRSLLVELDGGGVTEWDEENAELVPRPKPGDRTPPNPAYPVKSVKVGDVIWMPATNYWVEVVAAKNDEDSGTEVRVKTPDCEYRGAFWYWMDLFQTDIPEPAQHPPVAAQPDTATKSDAPVAEPARPAKPRKSRPRWVIKDVNTGDYVATSSRDGFIYVTDYQHRAVTFSSAENAFQFLKTLEEDARGDYRVFRIGGAQ